MGTALGKTKDEAFLRKQRTEQPPEEGQGERPGCLASRRGQTGASRPPEPSGEEAGPDAFFAGSSSLATELDVGCRSLFGLAVFVHEALAGGAGGPLFVSAASCNRFHFIKLSQG